MKKLSKYEKETIVNFNEGEPEASIFTFNADLKRRLAEFSRKYPLLCRLTARNDGRRQGLMQKNMDSNQFRMYRRLSEIINEGSAG